MKNCAVILAGGEGKRMKSDKPKTLSEVLGRPMPQLDRFTAVGALASYISDHTVTKFQPMNINFGIMPPLDHRVKGKRNKNAELSQRSLAIIEARKEEILS